MGIILGHFSFAHVLYYQMRDLSLRLQVATIYLLRDLVQGTFWQRLRYGIWLVYT
jgi:hypothetical protein